uniref:Mitochondrial glyco protein n=1 Tax=Globisporangium ultimum (strain ATCC 200006 / CBS 805.95 / DAOM BR144) TaxID=431595 RepID=K3WAS0_GLOUD
MLARVARAASVSMAKRTSVAAPALGAFQLREKSSLTSLLKREIEEEKGNCFEGEELEELHAKMNKIFTLKETPGNMEIVLTGQVGTDSIRIKFDSQDVVELEEDYVDEDEEEEEEEANYDEEEEEEDGEEDELPGIRFVADVTRDNQGLQFECVASSNLTVERVRFLSDFSANAEKDNLYFGPNFADMELDVQEKFYDYLAERKIDDDLAQFITQYADLKEQREYLSFLESAETFIKN